MTERSLLELIETLWVREPDDILATLLPIDMDSLRSFRSRLREFVDRFPRSREGTIDPGAVVRGDIVSMGPGSAIEAGVVIHASCRLVLGRGSVVRSGAVLRDEVVVGEGCTIGVNCEVVRSVLLGPATVVTHFVFVGDSVVGRDALVAGYSHTANASLRPGRTVRMKYRGARVDTGRTHFGALIGDGVRIGGAVTLCPGCVVLPGLTIPPAAVLFGTIDRGASEILTRRFYDEWDLDGDASKPFGDEQE